MSILVVGSVALDSVETPTGCRERILGGACTYFAVAASLYDRVAMVGVVGDDFPTHHIEFLCSRDVDTSGLQCVSGKTFFWAGRYGADMGDVQTLDTQLNVFADFHPVVPPSLAASDYLFLANIDPELQLEVMAQVQRPKLVTLDSMNYWITSKRAALTRALQAVDVALLNESEVSLFTGECNLADGARQLLDLGLRALVVKRGRHGATLLARGPSGALTHFFVPAYPVEQVVDPTGAGDTFAAGFLGYLARAGGRPSLSRMRRALVHGSIIASFTIQDFSIDRLRSLTMEQIEARYAEMRKMTHFEP